MGGVSDRRSGGRGRGGVGWGCGSTRPWVSRPESTLTVSEALYNILILRPFLWSSFIELVSSSMRKRISITVVLNLVGMSFLYLFSLSHTRSGIISGETDTKEKANICNRQFQSVFTREADSDPPSKGASPFSSIGEITVDPKGEAKL